MGRILAIDYGRKRCGLARTDELRLSVNPLPAVAIADLFEVVERMLKEDAVEVVVLTRSTHRDGTENEVQADISRFAERLQKEMPQLQIAYQDEFASSREARQHLIATGVGKKARSQRGALDSVAAGIILERYLRTSGIW